MFKLIQPQTVVWPVKIAIPADGGKTLKAGFDCEFKLGDQDWIDDLIRDTVDDIDFLRRVIVGWTGVQDAEQNDLPFSDTDCLKMLKIPYVRSAILKAFWEAVAGAPAKN